MNPRALVIFAKEPRPGRSKTRMTPPWSPQEASELSLCFIRDTLNTALDVRDAVRYLFFSPEESLLFFQEVAPRGFVLIPQNGRDLRERCAHSVIHAFAEGHTQMVQIGTDTPQIRSEHIQAAFDLLEDYDMGLGPANDGGYYLLSLRRPAVEIYDHVAMGRDTVFQQIEANAAEQGLAMKTLPAWVDADTHEDLLLLWGDPEVRLGPHTREFLEERLARKSQE